MVQSQLIEIINYYKEVQSLTLLSEKFNICKSTLYYHLKKSGVDTKLDRKKLGERVRKFEIDPNFFSKIDTRDKAYITGILHSDGCITKRNNQVRIKLCDLDLLEEINKKIYKNRPTYSGGQSIPSHKKNSCIVISHPQIYTDVQKHGCCLDKTYNLKFPTTISEDLMSDYLRGFFDGDGCIYVNKKLKYRPATVKIIATRVWCESLVSYLNTLGIQSTIYDDKRHDNRVTGFTISNVSDILNFHRLIYKDINNQIFLKRKYDKYTEHFNFKTALI
jgi:intein/homing endonuclease